MTKITATQAELLRRAVSERECEIDAAEDAKPAKALIKKGLAISLAIDGGGGRLIITEAGRAALATPKTSVEERVDGVGDCAALDVAGEDSTPAMEAPPTDQASGAESPKGKLGVLIRLLQRPEGARVEEMMVATGWQAHSVRGAMSGALKKKLGLTIVSEKNGTERIYRIPA